jgi:chromosome partitioning protein
VADPNAILSQIGDLAQAGEKMIERLRKRAFLPESRKASTCASVSPRPHSCWAAPPIASVWPRTTDACPLPAGENGRRLGYSVQDMLNMREVLGASPPALRWTCPP